MGRGSSSLVLLVGETKRCRYILITGIVKSRLQLGGGGGGEPDMLHRVTVEPRGVVVELCGVAVEPRTLNVRLDGEGVGGRSFCLQLLTSPVVPE